MLLWWRPGSPPHPMSSFSKQIWVAPPPLNPSKVFSDPPLFFPKSKWSPLKSSAPAPHLQAINNDPFLTKVKLRLWRRRGRRLSKSFIIIFSGWLYHFKDFSYLFGPKFIGRKFYRWRHDNWPIGQWVIFHAAPDTAYVNQFFFPSEFIIWFKFIVVSRRDLLEKPANIKIENNGAVVYAGSSLTVHNLLFLVHNSKLKKLMRCFYWSVSSKW